ncbi:MAG: hypothetical protein KDJ37_15150 [Hyphomicrobiaceae bacterium]|nr:hypothetical protein [Hyphomicrobiaceae bacterium]
MKRLFKITLSSLALAFAVLTAPVAVSTASAAPAASAVDMMRAISQSSAKPVVDVHYRRHHRHWHKRKWRHRCHVVRRCWHNSWGHRRCRWVRRC